MFSKRRHKIIDKIRTGWGKAKPRSVGTVSRYYDLTTNEYHFHTLSNQTIHDIDIESLLGHIDRTESGIGMQYLYNTIMHPTNDLKSLENIQTCSDYFKNNVNVREDAQYELSVAEDRGCSNFIDIFSTSSETLKKYHVFQLLSALSVVFFIGIFFFNFLLLPFLAVAFINIAIHFILRERNEMHYGIISDIYNSLCCAKKLKKLLIDSPADEDLEKDLNDLDSFSKNYRLVNWAKPYDDFSSAFFFLLELLKGIFLVEIHFFYRLFTTAKTKERNLINIYTFIGKTDMYISIASLKSDPSTPACSPSLSKAEECLSFVNAYHPLIENYKTNSLTICSRSLLITGSNMSGKSSFLRTILINSVLGQTIYLCFAESFRSPFLKQYSSISIADDILNARSYYFNELLCIKELIDEVDTDSRKIFLIDEIYKGTNTTERIALSTNVLLFLISKNDIVVASTHDWELTQNLNDKFDNYYFSESVIDGKLYFDYILKKGSQQARNAIQLAIAVGYPALITDGSKNMIDDISFDMGKDKRKI